MKSGSWPAIGLILVFAVLIAASHGKTIVLVNDVAQTFDLSLGTASWVVSSVAAVAALASPLVGWGVDRFGERRAIALGLVIAILAGFSVSMAPDFRILISLRVVEGAGYISVVLGALSLLIKTTRGVRQQEALAVWPTASPIGGAIAVVLVSHVVGTGHWREVFQVHAGLLFLLLLAVPLLPKAPASEKRLLTLRKILGIYKHGPILRLGASLAGLYILDLGLTSVSQSYLAHTRGIAPTILGQMFAGGVVLMVLASILTSYMLKRQVHTVWIGLLGAALAIGGTIVTYSPSVPVNLVIAASVIGSGGGGILMSWLTTTIPAAAPDLDQIGSVGGVLSQILYIGMFLGPPLVFGIFDNFPREIFYLFVAGANLLPVALLSRPVRWKQKAVKAT